MSAERLRAYLQGWDDAPLDTLTPDGAYWTTTCTGSAARNVAHGPVKHPVARWIRAQAHGPPGFG